MLIFKTKNGNTALSWASHEGRDKVVKMLLNQTSGNNEVNVNLPNKYGNTALSLAARRE